MRIFASIGAFFHRIFRLTSVAQTILKGLVVVEEILTASVAALKEKDPEFKYLPSLEVVCNYVKVVKNYIRKYLLTSMSGEELDALEKRAIDHEKTVRALSTDDELASTLVEIQKGIPD